MRYLIRRLVHCFVLLIGVSLLAFLLFELAPGDYLDRLRLDPRISPATLEELRSSYGLDRSLPGKYLGWLSSVGAGHWGFSFAYGTPVAPLLWSRARNTLLLSVTSLLLAWSIAIPAGISWALTRRRATVWLWNAGTSAVLSLPEVLLALLLLLFALQTRWFPVGGMQSVRGATGSGSSLGDLLSHLFIPVMALSLPTASVLVRHVRAAIAEALDQPFYRSGEALGLSKARLLLHYAIRPAGTPLIVLMGLSIGALLSGSFVVEVVMGWPGLGPLILEAIRARDVYLVIGSVMSSAVLLLAGSVIADLLVFLNDPRTTAE